MAWARFSDDFPNHPKVIKVGIEAAWYFVKAVCYSNQQLTDGRIERDVWRHLAGSKAKSIGARLVDVVLFERDGDDFLIHDYHDYQPTAEAVREARRKNAEKQANHRNTKGTGKGTNHGSGPSSNPVTPPVTDHGSNGSPVPVPVPGFVPNPEIKNQRERESECTGADASNDGLSLSDFTSIWKKTHLEHLNCEWSVSVNAKTRDRIRGISQSDSKRIAAAAKFHMTTSKRGGTYPFNVEPGDFDNFVRNYSDCERGAIEKHWIAPIGVDGKPGPWWEDDCVACCGADADGRPSCPNELAHETKKIAEKRKADAAAVEAERAARRAEREAIAADPRRDAANKLAWLRAGRPIERTCEECGRTHVRGNLTSNRDCMAPLEDAAGEAPRYPEAVPA